MATILLIGIQVASLVVAAAFLLEYRRIARDRAAFLTALGSAPRRNASLLLILGYLLSLMLILTVSVSIFSLLP